MPDERRLLGVRGDWTDEQHVAIFDEPYHGGPQTDEQLIAWVREGTSAAGATMEPFATDGIRQLFSALRPEPAAAGALRLVAVHKYVLYSLIVLVVAVAGLVLTVRPIDQRLWWLGGLIVAVVLAAVFAPTFANAVLGDVFFTSLGLVLVVWLVRFLAWAAPKITAWIGTRPARAAAVATAVAAAATASSAATTSAPAAQAPAASRPTGDGGISDKPPPSPPDAGESPFQSEEGGPTHG
jgi:hypothetical protein